jgi:glycosyltransferase involved in cell wall biosynthesis
MMLGDGPLRQSVLKEIQISGLEDRITAPGWVTPEEVIQWFSRSDILFMPSFAEGLPVVGVQSLAMGLSIVASRIGGFIDLVDEGKNGYLIGHENPKGFVNRLEELLSNPAQLQAFRLSSRKKAYHFDIEKIAEAYEDLFLSVIQQE